MESLFIRRAVEDSTEKREDHLKKVAEEFVHFWEKVGKFHFREEEEILLPVYATHVSLDQDQDVMKMLADHALIRAKIAELNVFLENGAPFETHLVELGTILQNHVRLEENVIFPRLEKTLTESELQQVGRLLTRLHPKDSCEI
jgi:hemerythrin superfamily protein